MNRRMFTELMGAGMLFLASLGKVASVMAETITKVNRSDDEWKNQLSPKAYDVLRHEGTEAPFTSPLNEEKHKGTFVCAGCGFELFPSKYKFDSGTGWPSFYDVIPGHVETKTDYKIVVPRTEYHCARCGGHQGHIFEDGPKPTGLRYCNNGVALKFIPEKA
jgi:peptide-methionine (R)-S-oxide reductase